MIELKYKDQRLVVDPLGGGIAEYYKESDGNRHDIVYGYKNKEEQAGSMGDVLFPFPGRVENAEYDFNGQHYKLSGLRIKDGNAQHGFAKHAKWEVLNQTDHSVTIAFKMDESEYAEKGYPFSMNLRLEYYLNDEGLTCSATVENFGKTAAPFGLGFHPYFTLGNNNINDISMRIPAREFVEFDENLKPTGELLDMYDAPFTFLKKRAIDDEVIDNCFTEVVYEDGIAKTELSDNEGSSIVIWQDDNLPYIQVYSADTLDDKHKRKAIAIEAQTCCGYAFNMPEMGLKVLRPGERFEAKWGIIAK